MNLKLRKKIKSKIYDYCENSTTHGVRYLGQDTHWVNKLSWLVIILGGVSLCVYLSTIIWNNFERNPTVTVVETTHYPTSNIAFPAIVICDSRRVYPPNIHNISDILTKRGYNETIIEAFYDTLPRFKTNHPLIEPILKIHGLLEDIGITTSALLDLYSKPCDILMLECYWRSARYNCSQMFQKVLYHAGYCCRFDIPYFSKNAPSDVNLVAGHQKTEALRFIVNGELYNVSEGSKLDKENLDVYLFPPKHPMTVTDTAISLTRQTRLDFAVDAWVIDSSDGVKELSKESRQCLLSSDSYPEAGYLKGCISEGFHTEVLADCNCLPFYYTSSIVRDLPICTWEQHACIFKAIDKLKGNIAEVATRHNCYPDCVYVQYETEVDYIRHTRFLDTSDNNTDVIVHFFGNSCVKYRRDLLFTWDQLLASLGGIFGLCTGGSILSIIELLYYIADVVLVIFLYWKDINQLKSEKQVTAEKQLRKNTKGKNKKVSKGNNKIFLVDTKFPYID